jgi:tRNA (cytidine/uridine-2'-O-)-methyltransferase
MTHNFNVALFEPEIPPNTGNIIRLCANTNCKLHLIHPLGFSIDDKNMRRAGLDYHQHTIIQEHKNFAAFVKETPSKRIFAIETCGEKNYTDIQYQKGDVFLFGPETRGLPENILEQIPKENILNIPMSPNIRSINLSNTVAIVIYEAWRQLNFNGSMKI